jgi:TetR/AcrR family transcriptional repressor of nem operon
MRYPPERKQETRQRIIQKASRRFREKGEKRVAIAGLMRELKLTHGGFYRHFKSKQDLFGECLARGFEETRERFGRKAVKDAGRAGLRTIIEMYLSAEHCAKPSQGCPVAALMSDIARQPRAVRVRFENAAHDHMRRLEGFLPGKTEAERRRSFFLLFSGMAGALNLARAVADDETRRAILRDARQFYVNSFCKW